MGYFNWQDFPATIHVDPKDWNGAPATLKDFWTDELLGEAGPVLHLPPHHCRLIRVISK